ncbi:MAG: hypothetical protein M4D80_41700 [Myxococcota bacterium]|nr:hypothetical protein [Myxococcota bacterium]
MSNIQQPELKAAHATTIATLTSVTHDRIDAMRLAADLYAMSAYRAERAVALEAGAPSPRAPKPLSKYVRLFTTGLKARLNAIAGTFAAAELDRLKKLAPAIAGRLERNDLDLAEEIYKLVCMEPEDAVAWTREHLDEIETRFAS